MRRFLREHQVKRATSGQGTVEYALVVCAFIAILVALGALFKVASEGTLEKQAEQSASHAAHDLRTLSQDVLLY